MRQCPHEARDRTGRWKCGTRDGRCAWERQRTDYTCHLMEGKEQ
jgi:hypothetical protein